MDAYKLRYYQNARNLFMDDITKECKSKHEESEAALTCINKYKNAFDIVFETINQELVNEDKLIRIYKRSERIGIDNYSKLLKWENKFI